MLSVAHLGEIKTEPRVETSKQTINYKSIKKIVALRRIRIKLKAKIICNRPEIISPFIFSSKNFDVA